MSDETHDRLLDNAQAAELLAVSPRTLVKLREAGAIPFVQVADHTRGYRYSAKSLAAWIADREQKNTKPTAGAK